MHDQLSNKLHTRVLPISEAVADVTSFLCRLPATGCTGCSGRTCHRRPLIPLSATVGVDQCSPSAPGHAWRSKSQVTSVRRSRRAVAADAWLADLCAVVCVGCDTGLRCTGGTGVCVWKPQWLCLWLLSFTESCWRDLLVCLDLHRPVPVRVRSCAVAVVARAYPLIHAYADTRTCWPCQ